MKIEDYISEHNDLELLGHYCEGGKEYYYFKNNSVPSSDPLENSLIVIFNNGNFFEYTIIQACMEDRDFSMKKMEDC